ncbi:hypothetical protein GN244_ATG15101 [Phytophthora infestans]|uniref:Uncharacterized protein n=1 Tax=Phytophthora infestans TaxID=4787 RepID=A0A833STK9_PHYIN|nr:hypothetical protein GN244_ATG15101 [Phytophthora infestans]
MDEDAHQAVWNKPDLSEENLEEVLPDNIAIQRPGDLVQAGEQAGADIVDKFALAVDQPDQGSS